MSVKVPAVVAAALMAAGCFTSISQADDPRPMNSTDVEVQTNNNRPIVSVDAETDRDNASQVALRASDIQGMTIRNEAGTDLGEVRDIVLDTDRGQVKYVAVSYGGFLGLGTKLFAVPYEAFKFQPATRSEKANLVMNLDETTLRKAPGFDADNWPNMASPEFTEAINRHYGDKREGLNIQAGPVGIHIGGDRDKAEQPTNRMAIHRAADVIGMKVVNNTGEKVGSIHDLMIDSTNGNVRYAALSVGGLAGIGDSLYAVPWNNFRVKRDAQNETTELALNVDPQVLKNAKGFDQNHWPRSADVNFGAQPTQPRANGNADVDTRIDVPGVSIDVD